MNVNVDMVGENEHASSFCQREKGENIRTPAGLYFETYL